MTFASSILLGSDAFGATVDQRHDLGHRVQLVVRDALGRPAHCQAVYCRANAALTVGRLHEIPMVRSTNAFVVTNPVTTTFASSILSAAGQRFFGGVPLATIPSGEFGFLAVSGLFPLLASASTNARIRLFTTATAGAVSATDSTYELVNGVFQATTGAGALGDVYIPFDITIVRNS